ncbi:MAG: protein kinase family protein [Flavobacterium sp.]|nr:MAG: protein kinase family protein [Flavobacterium sp.]
MELFTKNDILISVKENRLIKDKDLLESSLSMLKNGWPEMYAGGFSQVFAFTRGSTKWAIKIWHRVIPEIELRYAALRNIQSKLQLPYFGEFQFVNKGIIINGQLADFVRLEWIEGLKLTEFISKHLEDKEALENLYRRFKTMFEDFHHNGISHGDLQHENIIICENGDIKLIDYDSICTSEIEGKADTCRGRIAFQHPVRIFSPMIASVRSDYFSELIILLSIRAIIDNPILWDKYNVVQAEDRLIFKQEDFLNWDDAEIKRDLFLLKPETIELTKALESYLSAHLFFEPVQF